jgi:hypothetical protein
MTAFCFPYHRDPATGLTTAVARPVELRVPPYPAGIVLMLRNRGHKVTIRENRHGSLRYRIDGGRELQAIEMDRWYSRRYD